MKPKALLLTVFLLIGCGVLFAIHDRTTDEGDELIVITEVHKSGVIFRTWEIEVSSGGEHFFTITDSETAQKLQRCIGCELNIHYIRRFWTPLRSDSNGCFLVSVKEWEKHVGN